MHRTAVVRVVLSNPKPFAQADEAAEAAQHFEELQAALADAEEQLADKAAQGERLATLEQQLRQQVTIDHSARQRQRAIWHGRKAQCSVSSRRAGHARQACHTSLMQLHMADFIFLYTHRNVCDVKCRKRQPRRGWQSCGTHRAPRTRRRCSCGS